MRILKENSIGLVIDIQERLVPVMEESGQFVENCTKLIQGLQILGLPLLVTQQYTKGLGETIDEIKTVVQDFQYIEKKDFSCLLSLIHISEPTRLGMISYAVFC